jgi:hypothetical protein
VSGGCDGRGKKKRKRLFEDLVSDEAIEHFHAAQRNAAGLGSILAAGIHRTSSSGAERNVDGFSHYS